MNAGPEPDDRLSRGEIGGAHLEYRSTNAARHERLYVGDAVALVKAVTDGTRRVANGRKGIIERIDEEHRRVLVRLDDGTAVKVHVPVSAPMVALRLAYAGHASRTQGSEAPIVLVVPGNGTTSLESGYSSLSRGKEEIHVFADTTTHGPEPAEHLAKRWQRPDPKRTATSRARERTGGSSGATPPAEAEAAGAKAAESGKVRRRSPKRVARKRAAGASGAPKKRRRQLVSARLAKARAALVSGQRREQGAKPRALSGKASANSEQRTKRIRLVAPGMARVRSLKAKLQAKERDGRKARGAGRTDPPQPTRRRSRPGLGRDRRGPDLGL